MTTTKQKKKESTHRAKKARILWVEGNAQAVSRAARERQLFEEQAHVGVNTIAEIVDAALARKACPGRSRELFVRAVLAVLATLMNSNEQMKMAVITLLMVVACFRPRETMTLLRSDLIPPAPGISKNCSEHVGRIDSMAWIGPVLHVLHQGHAANHVFSFTNRGVW